MLEEERLARRKAIVQARLDYPHRTAAEIAPEFGITGERVRQILQSEGVENCVPIVLKREKRICPRCSQEFLVAPSTPAKYCSRACQLAPRLRFVCEECGVEVLRTVSQIKAADKLNKRIVAKTRHVFCSRGCHGRFLGREHGIQTRPRPPLKTHCLRGHEYTEENTYRYLRNTEHRTCRACERHRYHARREARKIGEKNSGAEATS